MAIAVATVVLVPLVVMARTVWVEGGADLGDIFSSPGLGIAVRNTFALAVTVTLIAVPLGTMLALALRRPDLPGRTFWRAVVLLPVLVPDFVLGYSWLRAYGRAGFTDDLLGLHWIGVQGPVGVTVVVVVNAVPLVYLITTVGLAARSEPAMERAARVSGAGALSVLRTITVPLLRPATATAAVLVFVLTLGTFAIPQVMGSPAGFTTITTRIYSNLSRSSDPRAFVEAVTLALLLVVIAVIVVTPADALLGPRLRVKRAATSDPTSAIGSRAASRLAAAAVGCYSLLAVGLPLLALIATAVTKAVGLPPTPANWTLGNFTSVLSLRTGAALSRSLLLAAIAASVLVLLGGLVAALERGRSGRSVATLVTLTLVLPGSTLALGMIIAYGRWLGGTLAIILFAYVAKLWAVAHRPISGALDRLPPDELHASRVSGAGPLSAIRTVVLRPLAPALLAAWLVCFLTALHEVTMSSLLYGPGSETLAVVVLNSTELGQIGATAALSVLITAVLLVPAAAFWVVIRALNRGAARGSAVAQGLSPLPELTHAH
ncbi:MAG: iron ABC transporter permease [Geodermatophilaceae bacterium]|nr:iron ABC transporter permease [Geodermatophilaceae bacterium]